MRLHHYPLHLLMSLIMLVGAESCAASRELRPMPASTPAAYSSVTSVAISAFSTEIPTASCPVTRPKQSGLGPNGTNFGNDGLWTNLPPEGVRFFSGTQIQDDGSLTDKWPWWREGRAAGSLTVSGHRLDSPAPPLQAAYPTNYGTTGFQAGGIQFPTEGCWEVTGQSGEARLSFVVLVRRGFDR
jgi:hypothetical protein